MEIPVGHVCCVKGNETSHIRAEVATMLIFAAVSEAEVERLLSTQKRIQGQYMTSISPEGLTESFDLHGLALLVQCMSHNENQDEINISKISNNHIM